MASLWLCRNALHFGRRSTRLSPIDVVVDFEIVLSVRWPWSNCKAVGRRRNAERRLRFDWRAESDDGAKQMPCVPNETKQKNGIQQTKQIDRPQRRKKGNSGHFFCLRLCIENVSNAGPLQTHSFVYFLHSTGSSFFFFACHSLMTCPSIGSSRTHFFFCYR